MCGVLINRHALWIGAHYSSFYRRWCINLLPCVTIWYCKTGGTPPTRGRL